MIEPSMAVSGIRQQLRDTVLPAVDDDQARTALVAALGILGDLAPRLRADETWCDESARLLAHGIADWRTSLRGPAARAVLADVDEPPRPHETAAEHRRRLLAAIRDLTRALWSEGAGEPEGLDEIRAVLRRELRIQQPRRAEA